MLSVKKVKDIVYIQISNEVTRLSICTLDLNKEYDTAEFYVDDAIEVLGEAEERELMKGYMGAFIDSQIRQGRERGNNG
jgi:hypothetical protein